LVTSIVTLLARVGSQHKSRWFLPVKTGWQKVLVTEIGKKNEMTFIYENRYRGFTLNQKKQTRCIYKLVRTE